MSNLESEIDVPIANLLRKLKDSSTQKISEFIKNELKILDDFLNQKTIDLENLNDTITEMAAPSPRDDSDIVIEQPIWLQLENGENLEEQEFTEIDTKTSANDIVTSSDDNDIVIEQPIWLQLEEKEQQSVEVNTDFSVSNDDFDWLDSDIEDSIDQELLEVDHEDVIELTENDISTVSLLNKQDSIEEISDIVEQPNWLQPAQDDIIFEKDLEDCPICCENKEYYEGVCINCYIQGFNLNMKINGVDPYEIRDYMINNGDSSETIETICAKLDVEKDIQNNINFTRCKCGTVHERPLKNIDIPQTIYCENCGYFCSNCMEKSHFSDEVILSCDEYQNLIDFNNSSFVKEWKARLLKDIKLANEKANEVLEEENKTIDLLNKEEVRICAYCTWFGARQYELMMIRNDSIKKEDAWTNKYTAEEWDSAPCKCKSENIPVTKLHCSDMICGIHNPERRLITDGKSNKCCGRRIDWKYWTKYKPVRYDSKLTNVGVMRDLVKEGVSLKYDCGICKETKTILNVQCTDKNCKYYEQKICGECIMKNSNLKPLIPVMTMIETHGTETFTFTSKDGGKSFSGLYYDTYVTIQYDTEMLMWTFVNKYKSKTIITGIYSPDIHIGFSSEVQLMYGKNIIIEMICLVENDNPNRCSYELLNYNCIKDNHIVQFTGLNKQKPNRCSYELLNDNCIKDNHIVQFTGLNKQKPNVKLVVNKRIKKKKMINGCCVIL